MKIEIKDVTEVGVGGGYSRVKPLPVVEIFGNTIQGEGPRLRPAIFIRTGLCNLKCEGFGCTRVAPNGQTIVGCDTIHAVSPKFKDTWKEFTDHLDILNVVHELAGGKQFKPDVIITGGEPTMHWDNPIFRNLLKALLDEGFHVTIESNGSRNLKFDEAWMRHLQFSLSVKLSNSGEDRRKRLNFGTLSKIFGGTDNSYLKFVVNPETWDNLEGEILEIIDHVKTVKSDAPVHLMPMGETIEKQLKNTRFVFDKCAEMGFNFSPRAHILAYNDLDGV